ncbi:MAG: HmuY family protein [Ignavibacteria bacterium]
MIKSFFLSAIIALTLVSCTDDDNVVNIGGGDTVITKTFVGQVPDTLISKYLYFSFEADSFIPASQSGSDAWDIRLPYLYGGGKTRSIDIVLNSGTININGKTKGRIIDTTFDLLQSAPIDDQLKIDDTTITNRIIPIAIDGTGMFTYEPASRTINPAPQKTLVLKTKSGKYVKFQVLSLYKGQPATPSMMSELGYYSFRYAKSNSRNLKTN